MKRRIVGAVGASRARRAARRDGLGPWQQHPDHRLCRVIPQAGLYLVLAKAEVFTGENGGVFCSLRKPA